MHSPTPLLELRVQRHLLCQRMLEAVFGDRIERLFEDEIAILQHAQRQAQFHFGERRLADLVEDTPQNRLGKLYTDDRRRLQDELLLLTKTIDAGRQQR